VNMWSTDFTVLTAVQRWNSDAQSTPKALRGEQMKAIMVLEESSATKFPRIGSDEIFSNIKRFDNIDYDQENFIVFFLDSQSRLIGAEILFIGGLNYVGCDPKIIFRRALHNNANSIVIAHNHPSTDLEPSVNDKTFFRQLKEAGQIVGIGVVDSIIFNEKEYYSILKEL